MSPLPQHAAQAMLAHLDAVYPMTPGLVSDINQVVEFIKPKRMEYLLQPGQVCERLYYIHKGLLRCYYELTDEETGQTKEVSTWFMRERDTCVSVESYYLQEPSYEYIQTLEHSELFSIKKADLDALFLKHLEFNYIGRLLTINYLVDWVRQINGIRKLKVADRYEALRKRDPELLQRVPQKYLASFLDTTPETLTRIRSGAIN
jgi:CRP-like cAMP-binding protein